MSHVLIMAEDKDEKRFVFPLSEIIIDSDRDRKNIHVERIVHYPMGYGFDISKVFWTENTDAAMEFLMGKKPNSKTSEAFAEYK